MLMPVISTSPAIIPAAFNDNALPSNFIVGRTYYTRSICDHDCIFRFTVLSRTDKMITISTGKNKSVRRKVWVSDGFENMYPYGQYSMAPVLRASHQTRLD